MNLFNLLLTARSITVSPVSVTFDRENGSRRDYLRESLREMLYNYTVRWDDSSSNETRIGDLFAFVQGGGTNPAESDGGRVEIRRVIGILPKNDRPQVWDANDPSHQERQVLLLSTVQCVCRLDTFYHILQREVYGKVVNDVQYLSPRMGTKRWKITEILTTYMNQHSRFTSEDFLFYTLLNTPRHEVVEAFRNELDVSEINAVYGCFDL